MWAQSLVKKLSHCPMRGISFIFKLDNELLCRFDQMKIYSLGINHLRSKRCFDIENAAETEHYPKNHSIAKHLNVAVQPHMIKPVVIITKVVIVISTEIIYFPKWKNSAKWYRAIKVLILCCISTQILTFLIVGCKWNKNQSTTPSTSRWAISKRNCPLY